jgi:hypothetical protein
VTAENAIGLSVSGYSQVIVVDDTPPTPGIVVDLPSISQIDPYDADRTVKMTRKACSTIEGMKIE